MGADGVADLQCGLRAPGTPASFGGKEEGEFPFLSGHPRQFRTQRSRTPDPLNRFQVGPVAVAGFNRVPLAGPVLEPPTPHGEIGAMLGVPGPVLRLDESEAPLREQAERFGVVIHGSTVGPGGD